MKNFLVLFLNMILIGCSGGLSAPPSPAPSIPTGVAVTGGNGQVVLSWTAVTGALAYNVYYATAAGVTTTSGTKITGATSGNTITGLTNGTAYYFVVTAVNAYGESPVSNQVSKIPQITAPAGVTVTGDNTQLTLNWTAVTGAASYNVYYATAAGVTTTSGTKITGATSGNTITGLTNGTPYYFVVTAVSAAGNESPISSEVSATQPLPVPTGVTITGGNAQVVLNWTAVTGAASYNVYYGTAAGVTAASGTKITGATSGNTITGLKNGTTYYFLVTAVNAVEESLVSSEVSATPQFPGMTNPSTGTATNITDVSATLNGSFINPASYTTTAWVEWGATTAYGNITPSLSYAYPGSIRPSISISSLIVGTTYHYRFCTQNSDGKWCGNDATFTTVPMKPKTPLLSALTYPIQMAVDATNIYWTEGGAAGAVKMAPLVGGTVTTLASSTTNDLTLKDPYGIAVDANNVYWTDQGGGTVKSVPIVALGVRTVTTLASALKNPQYIAVDTTNVYFTEFGSWNAAAGVRNADGTVSKVLIIGGTVVQLATGLNGPQTIKVDATNIYWTEVANFIGSAGTVKKVPIIGGTVTTLVSGLSGSQYIEIDSTSAYYWPGYGTMAAVPIGGATITNPVVELTSGMNGTPPLIVDSTGIYWTESSNGGTVKKLNKAGWNVTILASWLSNPQWVAQDATNIYWLQGSTFNGAAWANDGAIYKILK